MYYIKINRKILRRYEEFILKMILKTAIFGFKLYKIWLKIFININVIPGFGQSGRPPILLVKQSAKTL